MNQEKRSILVVDGSASSVFYTSMVLKKLNYGVRTANNAEDALNSIAGAAPALVITDAVLPKMSGVDMLVHLKQNPALKFIPVIVQTARDDAALQEACTKAGCSCYFIKPVEPTALFQAIQFATEATPRKNIRIGVALPARVGDGAGARSEEITSLSVGGMYVKTRNPEPEKTVVPVTFTIGSREIRTASEVLFRSTDASRRNSVPGMGMLFRSISSEDRSFIADFIKLQVMKDLLTTTR